jgi:peroxiredoxin
MDHLDEGSVAPDFELLTPDGVPGILSEALKSGPMALAFYKASCPTSQLTFPFIQKIFQGLEEDTEPRIWGISQDNSAETAAFIAEHGLKFPVLIDDHPHEVSRAYELRFVPTLYLIDRDQRIILADFGFSKPALNAIGESIADAMGCPPPKVFFDGDGLPNRRPG